MCIVKTIYASIRTILNFGDSCACHCCVRHIGLSVHLNVPGSERCLLSGYWESWCAVKRVLCGAVFGICAGLTGKSMCVVERGDVHHGGHGGSLGLPGNHNPHILNHSFDHLRGDGELEHGQWVRSDGSALLHDSILNYRWSVDDLHLRHWLWELQRAPRDSGHGWLSRFVWSTPSSPFFYPERVRHTRLSLSGGGAGALRLPLLRFL